MPDPARQHLPRTLERAALLGRFHEGGAAPMLWKIRTELADRPGALAELAARCGADAINILSLEVFTAESGAVDELVVSTGAGWSATELSALADQAGCTRTTVKP